MSKILTKQRKNNGNKQLSETARKMLNIIV